MAIAAVILTGCKSLYGKYERPEVNTSGVFRDVVSDKDTLVATDTVTFANIPWRSVFTDTQLQRLIEQGLGHNPNLLNAALNVQMAEAQLKAAKLSFLPRLLLRHKALSLHGMETRQTRFTACRLQPVGT